MFWASPTQKTNHDTSTPSTTVSSTLGKRSPPPSTLYFEVQKRARVSKFKCSGAGMDIVPGLEGATTETTKMIDNNDLLSECEDANTLSSTCIPSTET